MPGSFPLEDFNSLLGEISHYNYFRDYDPELGRYAQPDPIGLQGGVNLFSYVGGNPISKSDPLGLLEWTGTVTGGHFFTAGFMSFVLTSECVYGEKATATILATGPGLGLGLDFSATKSDITFQDSLHFIEPGVFNGEFFSIGANFSWPPTAGQRLGKIMGGGSGTGPDGYGANAIRLGNAGSVDAGPIYGLSIGAGFLYGTSTVTSVERTDCECD